MICNITERGVKPRDDLTQEALAEAAECIDPTNEICCHKDEIIEKWKSNLCADHDNVGFR